MGLEECINSFFSELTRTMQMNNLLICPGNGEARRDSCDFVLDEHKMLPYKLKCKFITTNWNCNVVTLKCCQGGGGRKWRELECVTRPQLTIRKPGVCVLFQPIIPRKFLMVWRQLCLISRKFEYKLNSQTLVSFRLLLCDVWFAERPLTTKDA